MFLLRFIKETKGLYPKEIKYLYAEVSEQSMRSSSVDEEL